MVVSSQVVRNVEPLQTKLYLPLEWARSLPAKAEIVFKECSFQRLLMTAVNPKTTPALVKRYKVVLHHGSAWVSVPKSWLQDRSVRNGDRLAIILDGGKYYVTYERKPKAVPCP